MAKGNIGNLLQHFVALHSAQALLTRWGRPDQAILYVDCYSMAPWEPITGGNSQGFDSLLRLFPVKAQQGDLVASTFRTTWHTRYSPGSLPDGPRQRDYPNTAVLLRAAFPNQIWHMRLHDISPEKRQELEDWARQQAMGAYAVAGNWAKSPLIFKSPVAPDRPILGMLDPLQIIANDDPKAKDDNEKALKDGYLPEQSICFLFGQHALRLKDRPSQPEAPPAIVMLFSYSDANPQVSSRIVASHFDRSGWSVEAVRSGPWKTHAQDTYHLGWIASCGLATPLVHPSFQAAWDDWSRLK